MPIDGTSPTTIVPSIAPYYIAIAIAGVIVYSPGCGGHRQKQGTPKHNCKWKSKAEDVRLEAIDVEGAKKKNTVIYNYLSSIYTFNAQPSDIPLL